MPGMPLEQNITCATCGYNLRGLTSGHDCPECGHPVMESLEWAAQFSPEEWEAGELLSRAQAFPIAQLTGYPIDAVLFVNDVVNHAMHRLGSDGRNQVGAPEICAAVRSFAGRYFNNAAEALNLLCEWELRRSEDVGRIVWAMADAGWIERSPGDSPEDFAGIFTLDDVIKDLP